MSEIRELPELKTVPISRGPKDAVRLGAVCQTDGMDIFQGIVEVGGSMASHAGEKDLLVILRSGSGAFTVDSSQGEHDEIPCRAGDAVLVKAGAEHGFRNAGGEALSFLAIRRSEGGE